MAAMPARPAMKRDRKPLLVLFSSPMDVDSTVPHTFFLHNLFVFNSRIKWVIASLLPAVLLEPFFSSRSPFRLGIQMFTVSPYVGVHDIYPDHVNGPCDKKNIPKDTIKEVDDFCLPNMVVSLFLL
ncbi:MAG: hypothetical protein QXV39_08625 [Candidatus Caldarchaeum sp.]